MAARDAHLVSAYQNALDRAAEHGCRSVGVCLLSAGVFRGAHPLGDVVQIGVRTLVHALHARGGARGSGLASVHLFGYTAEEQALLGTVGAEVAAEVAAGGDGGGHSIVRRLLS